MTQAGTVLYRLDANASTATPAQLTMTWVTASGLYSLSVEITPLIGGSPSIATKTATVLAACS
jgi:hypothetical protein